MCPKAMTYCGGTTTLWRHLSTKHHIKKPNANTVEEQRSSSNTGPMQLSTQNSMARAKKVSIEEAVAYLAAHDRSSFRTISESEIVKMGLRAMGLEAPDPHTSVAKLVNANPRTLKTFLKGHKAGKRRQEQTEEGRLQ